MHVGAANAAAPHAHERFAGFEFGDRAFVNAQILDAVQDGG
jgi:hypothetical protein